MKQVFTLALLAAVACSGAELTTLSKCIEKGFQPGEVACSTCERLSAAVSTLGASESEAVVSDCKSCCSDVLDYTSPVKYATVELRLCKYSLGSHGGVNEFVEKSAWKDQIAITDIMGASAHSGSNCIKQLSRDLDLPDARGLPRRLTALFINANVWTPAVRMSFPSPCRPRAHSDPVPPRNNQHCRRCGPRGRSGAAAVNRRRQLEDRADRGVSAGEDRPGTV